ncbi:hypothetical protein K2Z83_13365 [Oscillochloris sp. ZM17-4]|uniref:hypothetical protein n=1 Tax=Oscillochloris sp. ZM17-4 TaxID=2866714 RepID=UPI001C73AFAD|nr:hypothetical protein [Oscillochloris sp. ZM17-4]MBX0328665.1 hypothetical protein [Oscillochloris sp. ZM17-4]
MSDDILPNDIPNDEDGADGEEMTPKALAAFEQYYALGPGRSLRKLAAEAGVAQRQLERWSSRYDWPRLARERHTEEVEAARSAARKEAATLARRRLRNAQLMQEAALTIFSLAKLTDMEPDEARKALPDARFLLVEGMKAERLELGEATETTATVAPPKPIGEMSDEELHAYVALLEEQA